MHLAREPHNPLNDTLCAIVDAQQAVVLQPVGNLDHWIARAHQGLTNALNIQPAELGHIRSQQNAHREKGTTKKARARYNQIVAIALKPEDFGCASAQEREAALVGAAKLLRQAFGLPRSVRA